jgi:hypothetical protein
MKPGTKIEVLRNPQAVPCGNGVVVDLKDYPLMEELFGESLSIPVILDAIDTEGDCFMCPQHYLKEITDATETS